MKRLWLILAVLLTAGLVPAAAAYASPPVYEHGTYVMTNTQVLEMRQADGNTFILYRFEQVFSGDTTGTAIVYQHTTVHADGSLNIRGVGTCDDCTLLGEPMTSSVLMLEGTGNVTEGVHGTWQLAGGPIQGRGTFNNPYGGTATYEGWVHLP